MGEGLFLTGQTLILLLICLDSSTARNKAVSSNNWTKVNPRLKNSTSTFGSLLDSSNWAVLSKIIKNGGGQRTAGLKLSVFERILIANAKARSAVGRSGDKVFLYQGDIRVAEKDVKDIIKRGSAGRKKRALIKDRTALWTSPISYQLSSSLSVSTRKIIEGAIAEWQSTLPCLQWTKGTSPNGYLYFIRGDGCYSDVGRSGKTKQKLSIGDGCEDHGTVLHEIAHALGIYHEQSRPDRDQYVDIFWNNIIPNMKYNFEKQSTSEVDSLNSPYDFESVMHYSSTAFAKQWGLKTIQSKTGYTNFGDKNKLSTADKLQAERLYKCNGTATGTGPTGTVPTGTGSGSGSGPIMG